MRLDWHGVEAAFDSHRSGHHAYLDLETGEIVWWSDFLDAAEQDDILRRLNDDLERYVRVEPLRHGRLWQWMHDFTESIGEPRLRFRVSEALQLRGIFRKYRNVMDEHPEERDRWLRFKAERVHRDIDNWVSSLGLPVDNPAPWHDSIEDAPAGQADPVEEGIRIGRLLHEQGRKHEALTHFLRLVSDHPGSARAHLQLAFQLDREGRETEAIPQYEQAIILGLRHDDLHEACVCLASSWREVGDSKRALAVLEEALVRFPDDPVLTVMEALAQHDLGQHDRALARLANVVLGPPFSIPARWQSTLRQKVETVLRRRKR